MPRKATIPCAQCGTLFVPRSDTHRFCSYACRGASVRGTGKGRATYGESTCVHCGAVFTVKRREYSGKYCSRACSDATNKNPKAQPWDDVQCAYCGETFKRPPWQADVQCCSVKCGKRHQALTVRGEAHPLFKPKVKMACEVCGTVCEVKPSLVSRFRACSRRCATRIGQRAMPRISGIERMMAEVFDGLGLAYVQQREIGWCAVDFAFENARLVVEVDGDYWHGRPEQRKKDRARDAYLRKCGWRVMRLRECDIRADAIACGKNVLAMLHGDSSAQLALALPQSVPAGRSRPKPRHECA